jgi:outer membrane receptor protein involved in Fe transport
MTKFWLVALCCCFYAFAQAQTPPVKPIVIKGTIIDSLTGKPLGFVTIALADAATKLPAKNTLTKDDGSFTLSGIAPKKYTLSLIYVGYKTKTVAISGTDVVTNIGSVNMTASNKQLKEVSISVAKPLVKQEIDRLSYDIQADPESKALNVLEMMRKIPLLSLDGDDNVLLKGNSNYKIFINGKPSSLMARSPKDVMRAMPASSIQRIEVITTPPAKYDSEGLDGIINIITNKRVDNGYNGSLTLNERFPVGGPYQGGSLTVKQGQLGVSSYFGNSYSRQPDQFSNQTRITTGANPSRLTQDAFNHSKSHFSYAGIELSFEVDSLNLLTAEFNPNGGNSNSFNQNTSLNILQPQNIGYTLSNNGDNRNRGFDAGLNYQLGFKKSKDRLLTLSYRYSRFHNNSFNDIDVLNPLNYSTPDYNQTNKANSSEQTIQADYVHPLKKLTIEGGLKAILRDNFSDFRYDSLSPVTHQFAENPLRTNTYHNNQYIIGAYNTYTINLKTWGFKFGGRLEQTIVKADFLSTLSAVNRNYLNLVPSVSINKRFKNMSNINFGYTQRIQRPDINLLNPYVDRSNPNFISTGNPDLKPVVANNLQLSYSKYKKGSITIGIYYGFADNNVQSIAVYDAATKITSTTFSNIGKTRAVGNNISFSYPFIKNMNFNINTNVMHYSIEGVVGGAPTKNNAWQGMFLTGLGYKFKDGLRINSNISYSTPTITLQGKSNSFLSSGFSISRDLIKDKLSLATNITNPFTKYRHIERETSGINFVQSNFAQNYFRSFSFSINYRFGKLQQEIKKNKRNINNDDKNSSTGSN